MAASFRSLPKWLRWSVRLALLIGLVSAGGWAANQWHQPPPAMSSPTLPEERTLPAVGAWGRIAPQGEVLDLGPPTGMDGVRVQKLLVEEGDLVHRGDVIAVLDTFDQREAAVREAQAQRSVAEAKLAQAKEGAKPAEIAAQQAMVTKAQTELDHAQAEYARWKALADQKFASQENVAEKELLRNQAREALRQANAQVEALRTVRPVDVALATAELGKAISAIERAEADLAAAQIKAPSDGRILRVHARPGQRIGDKGVVEFGNTGVMYAVAEVYEADFPRVKVGQSARLRVPSLGEDLHGTVERLGWMVGRKVTLNNDPISDTDARVIEVRIRIKAADTERVAALSNARVEIRINVDR
ncbi:MAG TPA: HlyD family efflux transporter periplasmic adaptor subunit [Planctomycetaceae bacterium]|nr:HlyD family efflux transporter periplasmic adaptor subunit [Planctomycetaceae bacterium]